MNRQRVLMALALLGIASLSTAGATAASTAPCEPHQPAPGLAAQASPDPSETDPFPDYKLQASTSRSLPLTPVAAAAVLLDFEQQCRTCAYQLDNILAQEIIERDQIQHRFLVWRSVSKDINIGFKKIPVRSSSFAQVQVFESADRQHIVIDSQSLSDACAAHTSLHYAKPNNPAFVQLRTRWTLRALDPSRHGGMLVEIKGTTAGVPRGLAARAPKSMLGWELKNALEETLDLISP